MYTWSKALSVGVKELDEQHRRIFELINGILDFAARSPLEGRAELQGLLDDFMRYHVFHTANN